MDIVSLMVSAGDAYPFSVVESVTFFYVLENQHSHPRTYDSPTGN